MSVEIRRVTDAAEWNRCVERAPGASAFHLAAALRAQSRHTNSRVHPLVGYTGQEPVGLLPLFEVQNGPITAAFSPPPALWVPSLGPALLNVAKLNPRKRERRHEAFVTGCLDWLDAEIDPQYVRVGTDWRYGDVRPFLWNGFAMTPKFTYTLDLTVGTETLFERFSGDARTNVRRAEEAGGVVREGDAGDAGVIIERVIRRVENRGEALSLPPGFAVDLAERLPAGTIRTYVCYLDGERVGGHVTVEHGDRLVSWQGVTQTGLGVSLNELLEWRTMQEAAERGLSTYEVVGAGNPRTNRYKAKFDPRMRTTYELERGSPAMTALVEVRKRLGRLIAAAR